MLKALPKLAGLDFRAFCQIFIQHRQRCIPPCTEVYSANGSIIIQRNKMMIWTEAPVTEQIPAIGEQMPVDKHHNHYFKIAYDATQVDRIVSIIE